jgi:hypothetical protein
MRYIARQRVLLEETMVGAPEAAMEEKRAAVVVAADARDVKCNHWMTQDVGDKRVIQQQEEALSVSADRKSTPATLTC